MHRFFRFAAFTGLLAAAAVSAQALDPELTMRPITNPEVPLPAFVSELLARPDEPESIALEQTAPGLARADDEREDAVVRPRAFARGAERGVVGLGIATDARARAAELGAEMAEWARSLRESLVRGGSELGRPIPADLSGLAERVSARPGLEEAATTVRPSISSGL